MTANEEGNSDDDRTLYVGGLSEKMTEALLYELFFQAGPVSRVSIPKDKETGKIKQFGFITYKHLSSVDYAIQVFTGTKLFGKEIQLRNRNRNNQQMGLQQQYQRQISNSLAHGYGGNAPVGMDAMNQLQQHLLQLASADPVAQYAANQMFNLGSPYASARSDNQGSHRDHYVDRSRYHRDENRSNRSKPYRRSRSRSPQRSRDRSPQDYGRRGGGRSNEKGGYHRWGKR